MLAQAQAVFFSSASSSYGVGVRRGGKDWPEATRVHPCSSKARGADLGLSQRAQRARRFASKDCMRSPHEERVPYVAQSVGGCRPPDAEWADSVKSLN